MLELFIVWKLWDDQEPRDEPYGFILFAIFSQLVLWPATLAYIGVKYWDIRPLRSITASAVLTAFLLLWFPMGFAIIGIIATLVTAWKVLDDLDVI